jgi:hypothetical protein
MIGESSHGFSARLKPGIKGYSKSLTDLKVDRHAPKRHGTTRYLGRSNVV